MFLIVAKAQIVEHIFYSEFSADSWFPTPNHVEALPLALASVLSCSGRSIGLFSCVFSLTHLLFSHFPDVNQSSSSPR
jgi:hypothetical protein